MLINEAMAATTAGAAGPTDLIAQFAPLLFIFVLFFFMIIRPQMKRAKEQRAMIDALAKGDEVVTSGGLIGKVSKVGDTTVALEIADNVVVQVQKQAVTSVAKAGAKAA